METRRPPRSTARPLAMAAATLLLALATAARGAPATGLSPERLGWTRIAMGGSKLFIAADAELDWSRGPATAVSLRTAPEGRGVAPGREVVTLRYQAGAIGRRVSATLHMDPVSGAALQREQVDQGGRQRIRVYRYTDRGGYHWTRWPQTGEEQLPPTRWSRVEEGLRPYDASDGVPVLEPTGLIYAVSAAALAAAGDRASFRIFQRKDLLDVETRVTGRRQVNVDYTEETPAGPQRRRGKREALLIRLRGDPTRGDAGDELELLGLTGELELALDPLTRAPLQLTGNIAVLGKVTLRLKALRPVAGLASRSAAP